MKNLFLMFAFILTTASMSAQANRGDSPAAERATSSRSPASSQASDSKSEGVKENPNPGYFRKVNKNNNSNSDSAKQLREINKEDDFTPKKPVSKPKTRKEAPGCGKC